MRKNWAYYYRNSAVDAVLKKENSFTDSSYVCMYVCMSLSRQAVVRVEGGQGKVEIFGGAKKSASTELMRGELNGWVM